MTRDFDTRASVDDVIAVMNHTGLTKKPEPEPFAMAGIAKHTKSPERSDSLKNKFRTMAIRCAKFNC